MSLLCCVNTMHYLQEERVHKYRVGNAMMRERKWKGWLHKERQSKGYI